LSIKFGTDGVRGVANVDLTPEVVLALGRATVRVLGAHDFLVARDTRVSSPVLSGALTTGLAAEGADVVDLGVLPTPALARLAAARSVPAVMISASHNPYPDNGVKVFGVGGRKLSDDDEARITAAVGGAGRDGPVGQVTSESVGEWYVDQVVGTLEGRRVGGLHVVLDCACGAASFVAPAVFRAAGAEVTVIHDDPGDGTRINDGCGSTHPESLQQEVVDRRADVGLALDGDADRVLAVDHKGALVDGDHIMAVCALDWRERGRLHGETVVITVMTNLGFRLAMGEHDVKVVETQVGDRYVLEALEAGGYSLGGEQSGHIIFRDLATTGDGILTGLHLVDAVARAKRPLNELATVMTRLPQVLHNVKVADRNVLAGADALWAEVAAVESELGDHGRVLIRPSGTEPLIRVMVEAPTEALAEAAAARLVAILEAITVGKRQLLPPE
jgi:phosphoglucosamine mutase